MGCFIRCNDVVILRLTNYAMANFYEKIVDLIVESGLGYYHKLVKFITTCDQDIYGIGAIYPDAGITFKNSPEELYVFITMLNTAIPELCKEHDYDDEIKKELYAFRDRLLEFYKTMT